MDSTLVLPVASRQRHVKGLTNADCDCFYCVNDITDSKLEFSNYDRFCLTQQNYHRQLQREPSNETLEALLKEQWKIVNELDPMSKEVHVLQVSNKHILNRLANTITFCR